MNLASNPLPKCSTALYQELHSLWSKSGWNFVTVFNTVKWTWSIWDMSSIVRSTDSYRTSHKCCLSIIWLPVKIILKMNTLYNHFALNAELPSWICISTVLSFSMISFNYFLSVVLMILLYFGNFLNSFWLGYYSHQEFYQVERRIQSYLPHFIIKASFEPSALVQIIHLVCLKR